MNRNFAAALVLFCLVFLTGCGQGKKDYVVTIKTKYGDMVAILYDETPKHKENFIKLAKEHYFDSLLFHRVIQGFMIQGGDPDSKKAQPGQRLGSGGPGYTVDAEINPKYFHEKEYVVKTSNKLRSNFKQKMEAGVNIESSPRQGGGYLTKKCQVAILNDFTFRVTLTEGKKHQIRRMCDALFQEVGDLKRIRIMNIELGKLQSGAHREIVGDELQTFLHSLDLA